MLFEELPTEILYEIWDFLDTVEIFYAFYGLNNHFNTILCVSFRGYSIDFDSVYKYQRKFPSRRCLLFFTKKILSLRLVDHREKGPPSTDLFFSLGLRLKQFIYLRSLSLPYIDCFQVMHKLMNSCHQLMHLTHLKVIECHKQYMGSIHFLNIIWGLLKCNHCYLQINNGSLHMPTIVSLTIQYLSIRCQLLGLRELNNLLSHTPHLQHLHVSLNKCNDDDNHHQTLPCVTSITILKLSDVTSSNTMINILQAMPNLTHLKVDTKYVNYDGNRWEQIIDTHLPNLKAFQFRMRIRPPVSTDNEKYVDQLINTFRSQFWLEKHQWFIRCHYEREYGIIILYTLPYAFIDFDLKILAVLYKSTCPLDDNYLSYDRVNSVSYTSFINYIFYVQFPNIRNLDIILPVDEQCWKIISTFNQLQSLTISSADEDSTLDLQSILNQGPRLHSLTFKSWKHSIGSVFENSIASLRRIDLQCNLREAHSLFLNEKSCETCIRQ